MKLELNFPSISMCTTFVCVQVYVYKFMCSSLSMCTSLQALFMCTVM